MNSSDIAIQVEHLSKDFILPYERKSSLKSVFTSVTGGSGGNADVQHALHDINFEIKRGEFFGIVGRNGSGKSTLLKILAGIYQPTKGSVKTHGKLVPFIELGVGFNPELTGKENVYLNGAMLGFSESEIAAMYKDIVAFAELEDFMNQKLKNYSSGMQVRLAFSMATRSQADILLVDEVLAVGDADFQRKCFDYFRELKKSHATVVFVTHDMNAVREYCDRAILIEKSEILAEGTPDKIATKYTRLFEKEFEAGAIDEVVDRWGDRNAELTNIEVSPAKITADVDYITIEMDVRANERVEDLTIGFRVRNATGAPLLGTNNNLRGAPLKPLDAGHVVHVTWQIPNIFNEGKYLIDTGIVYDFTTRTADWWDEAATFRVFKEERTPYFLNPPIGCEVRVG